MKIEDFYDTNCEKGTLVISVSITEDNRTVPYKAKINLYKLNGCSPELIVSKETDCDGQLVFKGLDFGYYRVVEVVNRQCIKPKYIPWNEFEINVDNLWQNIEIINTKIEGRHKIESIKCVKCVCEDFGNIKVKSILDECLKEPIEGLEVAIFKVETCEIKEVQCKITDCEGIVEFKKVPLVSI